MVQTQAGTGPGGRRYRPGERCTAPETTAPFGRIVVSHFAFWMHKMNIEQARFNMIEQQIRPWEVLDQEVLDLLYVVRREDFVPEAYRAFAFSDLEIPLYENAGEGERMMQPKVEARIL